MFVYAHIYLISYPSSLRRNNNNPSYWWFPVFIFTVLLVPFLAKDLLNDAEVCRREMLQLAAGKVAAKREEAGR